VHWGTAARLAAFLAIILALVLGGATFGLVRIFQSQSTSATQRSLVTELHEFQAEAAKRPPGESLHSFAQRFLRTRTFSEGDVFIVSLAGGPTYGSSGSAPLLASSQVRTWATHPESVGSQTSINTGSTRWLLATTPLVASDTGRPVATIAAAANTARTNRDLGRVVGLAAGEFGVAVLAAGAGCWLLLRRLLGRIHRITQAAAALGSGSLDRRLHETARGDEVGQLEVTFDSMADQLGSTLDAQRRLLSDVSHQLRTPLTVAKGHLEVLRMLGGDPDEVWNTCGLVLDEIDHMRSQVERLLTLGHAMEPDFVVREPVDLRSFGFDLLQSAKVIADRQWILEDVPDLVVEADADKLRGALLNLIDNAVHATSTGDIIALRVVDNHDGSVAVSVADSGPGVPVDRRQAVLNRFSRGGSAYSEGTGLGLAVARAVAEAHGGSVEISDSGYGGACVTLTLLVTSAHPSRASAQATP
jgi:two-component system, OmpR family, sensor kinase